MKKNRLFAWLCALLLLCMAAPAALAEGVMTLPAGLQQIEEEAFMGDASLEAVVIPDGVTAIAARAFAGCGNLAQVAIPYTVKTIAEDAFDGCERLSVTAVAGSYAWNWCTEHGVPVQALPVDTAGYTLSVIKSYVDGEFVEVASRIDSYTGDETALVLPACNETGLPVTEISYDAFAGNKRITSVVIPDTVTAINDGAFEGCTALEHVTLPQSLVRMNGAFEGCTALEEIDLPEGLETVGSAAFRGCTALRKISFPKTLKTICREAFAGCTALESLSFPAGLEVLGEAAFGDCVNLTSFNYPMNLTQGRESLVVLEDVQNGYDWLEGIKGPFAGCTKLTGAVIPEGVTKVAPFLFAGSEVRSISFPSTLRTIASCAFANCENLKAIDIPDHVNDLETFAFGGCENLTSVQLPTGWSAVGYSALREEWNYGTAYHSRIDAGPFYSCDGLTSFILPEGMTSLPEQAFYGMETLVSVHLPGTMARVEGYAFHGTGVAEVFLPEGVTAVHEQAFSGAQSLKTLWMGPALEVEKLFLYGWKPKITVHGLTKTPAETFAKENNHTFIADYRGSEHTYVPWHTTARHAHVLRYICADCGDSYRTNAADSSCWRCALMLAHPDGGDLPLDAFDMIDRCRIDGKTYIRAELLSAHAGVEPPQEGELSFWMDEALQVVTDEATLEKLLTMWLFVGGDDAWDYAQGENQALEQRRASVASLLENAAEQAALAKEIHTEDIAMEAVGELATSGLMALWGNPGGALKNFTQAITTDVADPQLLLTLVQMKVIDQMQETCMQTAETYSGLMDAIEAAYLAEECWDYDLCMQALDYYAAATAHWRMTTDVSGGIIQEIIDCQSAFGVGLRNVSKMLSAATEGDPIYFMAHNLSTKLTKAVSGGEAEAKDFLDVFVDTAKILADDIAGKATGIGAFVAAYKFGSFDLDVLFDVKAMFEAYDRTYNAFIIELSGSEMLRMHRQLGE